MVHQPVRVLTCALGGLAVVVATSHRCRRLTVHGASMVPTLMPGDRVLVVAGWRLTEGDIVAVPDPRQPARLLVKRISMVDRGRGTVSLLGDNADASTDSRTFGPVTRRAIIGRVVYRYSPADRAGRIGGRHSRLSPGRPAR